jgi:uncharacterized phage-associated protein
MKLNKEKMKEAIHYIISKCDYKKSFGRVVLYKLLYFSDFNYYELYEESLTGETYIRRDNGPVPNDFEIIKKELISEKKITEEKEIVITYPKYHYTSKKAPIINFLTFEEIAVIDDVINNLSDMNASQISDYSHGDMPWQATKDKEVINYEYVFYRDDEYSIREYND